MEHAITDESAMPLYLQLEAKLRAQIDSGSLSAGSKLPTEMELSDTYHVSRVTVRKALEILEDKAYIERKAGKGTFVAEQKLQRNLSSGVRSFTRMCEEMGTVASARTIRIMFEDPTPVQREQMGLKSGEKVLLIERIRYSDDQPVIIERDLFPESFDFLFAEDLNHNSLYQVVKERKGVVFTKASRVIDLVFATHTEGLMLGVKKGYPLLRISSITQDEMGNITTLSEQLCVGDKFKLRV